MVWSIWLVDLTIPPLNTSSVHPFAMYAFFVPSGTVSVQDEEMLEKALIREVKEDAGGYPYIDCESIELYDYKEDKPLAKPGQKVKIIVIIEDEK